MHLNDLLDSLTSNLKLLADDTLFSTATDANAAGDQTNDDLHNNSTWAYLWRVSFN